MWGHTVTIPTDLNGRKLFRPGALTIFSVAIMLLFFALVNLCLILPVLPMPVKYIRFPLMGIALMFLLRAVGDFNYLGFTKRFNKTLFAKLDYALISPLCLILGISHLIVAFCSELMPESPDRRSLEYSLLLTRQKSAKL